MSHFHSPSKEDHLPGFAEESDIEETQPLNFLMQTTHHGSRLPLEEDTRTRAGAPRCQRCEVLPLPPHGPGTLHLRFPLSHTLAKILGHLRAHGLSHHFEGGVISIEVPNRDIGEVVLPLVGALSSNESADARVLFQAQGKTLQMADFFDMSALSAFAARVQSEWLLSLLREQRLHVVFQPIMQARQGQSVLHGYECLMRGEVNGQTVSPGVMMEMARGADLMFQLDLAARRAAICGAAEHKIQQKVFINFGPTAIYDPVNCLRSTVNLIDREILKREQIVFEVIETDHVEDTSHLQNIIAYYRDNGFGVALDDLGSGYASLNMLHKLRPDYVKLDMELTRDVDRDPYKALIARKLLEAAQDLEVFSVAEGIETTDEWAWVDTHGADFVQGFLFARPATPPPILAK